MGVGVGTEAGSTLTGASCHGLFCGLLSIQTAAGAVAMTNARTSAGPSEAWLVSTGGRHGKRTLAAGAGHSDFRARLRRDHNSGIVAVSFRNFGRCENYASVAGTAEAGAFSAGTGKARTGADRGRRRNDIAGQRRIVARSGARHRGRWGNDFGCAKRRTLRSCGRRTCRCCACD
jgi:hypothetical protein